MSRELSTNVLETLKQAYPQSEDSFQRTYLPQIRFKAKSVLDDEDKVILKAGTFVNVIRSEEKNADNKHDYTEEVIGTSLKNVSVVYERYRLSFYDAANNSYVSSPLFDSKDEVAKLFSQGKEIASGTVSELQVPYQVEENGKKKNKLQLQKVLYIKMNDTLYEMALSVGNGYAWSNFKRSVEAPLVKITIDSKKTEYGGNKYNEMTFTAGDYLTEEEATENLKLVMEIRKGIEDEKMFYGQAPTPNDLTPVTGSDF